MSLIPIIIVLGRCSAAPVSDEQRRDSRCSRHVTMPIRRNRTPKPSSASPPPPPENERAEIETMLRRLEELRRTASNSELRSAYQAAIGRLDGVAYRLAMLRPLDAPKPAQRPTEASNATPPAPKATTPTRAAAARIGAARKRG
jgi:hypothetical protein